MSPGTILGNVVLLIFFINIAMVICPNVYRHYFHFFFLRKLCILFDENLLEIEVTLKSAWFIIYVRNLRKFTMLL